MDKKELPIGVRIEDSEDIHSGQPQVELIIECANEDIARDYFWKAEENIKLVKEYEEKIERLQKDSNMLAEAARLANNMSNNPDQVEELEDLLDGCNKVE